MRSAPTRMCAVCRGRFPRTELLRVARLADGGLELDPSGRRPGRGAYLCHEAACREPERLKPALARAFKASVGAGQTERIAQQAATLLSGPGVEGRRQDPRGVEASTMR